VVGQLAGECPLDQGLGELPEQPFLAEQVVGLLIIFEQFVEQFGSKWHNLVSFRD